MKGEKQLMRQRNFFQTIKGFFTLSETMFVNLPKVSIVDTKLCHIENHHGIVSFTDSQLILKAKSGFIIIVGSSLIITMMLQEELFLEGIVKEVKFSNNL